MRYCLIVLLGLITFLSPAQDTVSVCIQPSSARYFLEADDERWILREKDSLNTELILNLKEQVLVKDKIIETYQIDSATYNSRYVTLLEKIRLSNQELEQSYRDQRKLRRHRNIAIGAGGGAIVGSVIPGVGTLTGALIGAGVGWVSSIFIKH